MWRCVILEQNERIHKDRNFLLHMLVLNQWNTINYNEHQLGPFVRDLTYIRHIYIII